MSILKLNPGDRVSLTVRNVEVVEGNYGPQYKFSGETPGDSCAVIFLNLEPADKQLARAGLKSGTLVGETIDIERVEKNGTKYTNIYRASNITPSQQKQPFSAGPRIPQMDEPIDPTKLDRLFALYAVCLSEAMGQAGKMEDSIGTASPECVASMAATLFIQAAKVA
jgi:hypothetical protein